MPGTQDIFQLPFRSITKLDDQALLALDRNFKEIERSLSLSQLVIKRRQTYWDRAENINADGTIDTEKLSDRVVGLTHALQYAVQSVNENVIANNAVRGTHIAAGEVTAEHINVLSLSAISANLGTVTAGDILGVRVRQTTDLGVVLADIYKDTNGGRIKIYDINGLQNVVIGSESGTGDNVGGTFILYNDGDQLTDRRVEAGISTAYDAGIINLRDTNGAARAVVYANSNVGALIGILNSGGSAVTYLRETIGYINSQKIATEAWVTANFGGASNNYLTGVSGSGNGTVTFTREGLSDLTWNAAHTHSGYISDSSIKRGSSTFNGLSGRTITHSLGTYNYSVSITPAASSGIDSDIGTIYVVKSASSISVMNTGTSTMGFDYIIIPH
jgi:hypothetical protein